MSQGLWAHTVYTFLTHLHSSLRQKCTCLHHDSSSSLLPSLAGLLNMDHLLGVYFNPSFDEEGHFGTHVISL